MDIKKSNFLLCDLSDDRSFMIFTDIIRLYTILISKKELLLHVSDTSLKGILRMSDKRLLSFSAYFIMSYFDCCNSLRAYFDISLRIFSRIL